MKLFYLIFLCVFSLFYTLSCYIPPQLLGSTPSNDNNNNNNDDNDGDDGDDSTNDRDFCWNRDSCQDSCDSLFKNRSSQFECSELTFNEVNTLAEVSDLLNTRVSSGEMAIGTISSKDLKDINSKDLNLYLQVGFEDFLGAVRNDGGIGGSGSANIKAIMKWVAENEDIAKVIANHDTQHELGHRLFIKMTGAHATDGHKFYLRVSEGLAVVNLDPKENQTYQVVFNDSPYEARIEGSHLFDIDYDVGLIFDFIWGFIGQHLDSKSFLEHADYENNKAAIEWGHNTLKSFCENISSGHVNQCLQTVYCAHRVREGVGGSLSIENRDKVILDASNEHFKEDDPDSADPNDMIPKRRDYIQGLNSINTDGIFDLMDDHESIFGRTNVRFCNSAGIQDEGRLDNLFDP